MNNILNAVTCEVTISLPSPERWCHGQGHGKGKGKGYGNGRINSIARSH